MDDIVALVRPEIYAMAPYRSARTKGEQSALSKEYSLAGERCGITIAHPEVIGVLSRIMAPYPLTATAIRVIGMAVSAAGVLYGKENIERIRRERERVRIALESSPAALEVFASDANFILMRTADPGRLCTVLAEHGIKVRNRSDLVDGCVRLSIGTAEENDELLKVSGQHREAD